MLFNQIAPLLLLAGSSLAVPVANPQDVVVVKQLVVTETVMAGAAPTPPAGHAHPQGGHWPGQGQSQQSSSEDSGSATAPAPQQTQPASSPGAATPAKGSATPAKGSATPAKGSAIPTSTGSSTGGSTGGSSSYIDQINKYRGEMNKKTMTQDDKLQANALKTVTDSAGKLVHELNPGSMAQVLAGGDCTDSGFVTALVQGWICEIPSLLPSGTCKSGTYSSNGETGHAEILSSTSYSKAGCACVDSVWGCDFA